MATTRRTSPPAHARPGSTRRPAREEPPDERGGLLRRHRRDLWIVGLATLGALLILACWFGALGLGGHWLDVGLGRVLGWARFLLPLGLLCAAGLLIASRSEPEPLRVGIGGGLVLLAICGLCDLAASRPGVTASGAVLSSAGGWVGVAVGGPLAGVIGAPGAAVVLLAAAFVGIVVLTGLTLRTLAHGASTGVTQGARHFARWWAGGTLLRRGGERRDASADDGDEDDGYEDEDEDEDEGASDHDDVVAPRARREHDTAPTPSFEATGEVPVVAPAPPAAAGVHVGDWTLPDPGLLARTKVQRLDHRGVEALGAELVEALGAHGVETQLVGFTVGPPSRATSSSSARA